MNNKPYFRSTEKQTVISYDCKCVEKRVSYLLDASIKGIKVIDGHMNSKEMEFHKKKLEEYARRQHKGLSPDSKCTCEVNICFRQ